MVVEVKGRKRFSRGLWVAAERVAVLRAELDAERADPAWQRRLEAGRARRDRERWATGRTTSRAGTGFLEGLGPCRTRAASPREIRGSGALGKTALRIASHFER